MNIVTNVDNNVTTLQIEGSINTQTAGDFEKAIKDVLDKSKTLILDFTKVDYISSAGLRVLLMAQNGAEGKCDLKVTHPSKDVQEVFDMTGFSSILKVE